MKKTTLLIDKANGRIDFEYEQGSDNYVNFDSAARFLINYLGHLIGVTPILFTPDSLKKYMAEQDKKRIDRTRRTK